MALNRPVTPPEPEPQGPNPPPPPPKIPVEDEPISLVEPDESVEVEAASSDSTMGMSIRPMGSSESSIRRAIKSTLDVDRRKEFKRKPVNTGKGAIRCRVFHCKITESSIEHMENQINTWADDEDIDIKHVGHLVGAMEGKHTEPNIIVLVWY